ncbi:hypothetical protein K501DRAFT_289371 [Backusella circina FSU 941]|nr:hypothetical protein K501DRAFT_289371 [Backusella circina FSU 941]
MKSNISNIFKSSPTGIAEKSKETTSVVEHHMQEDDLTHPGLYRFKRNSLPVSSYRPQFDKSEVLNNSPKEKNEQWDLYPGLIREIENEGTPEQVEKLHQMQRSL